MSKKLLALVSMLAILTANSAFAAGLSLTGSTGTDLSLTGSVSTISGSTATGDLSVNVNATVLPTLSFNLAANSIALGDLSIGSYITKSLAYSGVTNAQNGMNVTVKSNLLNDGRGNKIGATGGQAGTSYKFNKGVAVDGATGTEFDTTAQSLDARNTKGTLNDTFQIGAQIAADTTAGNYTDTLTFTVTGNF